MAVSMESVSMGSGVWDLKRAPKYAAHGVVRTIPPVETIRRVTPLMAGIGVTRVAEVTGLDRVGIPNFTAVRPRELGEGISYYNGKGLTRPAAHAGALMEAVERQAAEFCDLPVHFGTHDQMRALGATVDPSEIIVPRSIEYQPDMPLEWVEGFDLLSKRPTFLPLNTVVCPYEPPPGRINLYFSSSNGLASGNTLEESLCHALCEIIERDATAVADTSANLAPAVGSILAQMGALAPRSAPRRSGRFPLIDPDSLPARSRTLVRRLRRAQLLVYLRNVTSTCGIAAFDCNIVERRLDGRHLAHGGSGCHPDARVAVSRAISEAAQSRVAHIQGGREDLDRIVGEPAPFDPEEMFGGGPLTPYSSVESVEHTHVDDDIRFLLERFKSDGFGQAVAIDLTRPDVGVPVVRVVVPRTEAWSVFFQHARSAVFGDRVGRLLRDEVNGGARVHGVSTH
jgi:ribosomal protein S12 methylthiotransferase accessory factor YcaO